jgi:phosphohistidine phosphatase
MAQNRKTLFLVRHAKSSWRDASLADIERPLNARGERNAPLMAQWLAARDDPPQRIISSPATRALATAAFMGASLGIDPADIDVQQDLYFAGTGGMLRALERVDDDWDRVMMVGHNPVMTRLLNQLTGCDIWNMPTCAIAVIGFDMPSWGLVDSTGGDLLDYQTPKRLDDAA